MARNEKMNISYTIRAIDKFTATHNKLSQQLDSLDRKFQQLEGRKTLDVDANTTGAVAQLENVERKMEAIDGKKSLTVSVDTMHIVAKLDQLQAKLAKIPNKKETKVDADTAQAEAQLSRVDRLAKRIKNLVVVRVMTVGFNDFKRQMNSIANFQRNMSEVISGLGIGTAITMLPGLLQATAGGLGAIASAAVPAALGFGGLAAVAIPTIMDITKKYTALKDARKKLAEAQTEKEITKATKELKSAMDAFTPSQLKAANALDKFGKFYTNFAKQFEPAILDGFTKSLALAEQFLRILEPAIHGTAKAVNNLIDSFARNLEADDMKAFFDWVGKTAGPNFEKLVQGVGNFIAGFANMMVAFDPLAQGFLDGFLRMSERFREWASTLSENQAFQDFVKAVQEQTPKVLSAIGNMVLFLWELIEAMAPASTWFMEVTGKLAKMGAEFLKNNPLVAKLIGGFLTMVSALFALGAPMLLVFNILKSMLGPAFTFAMTHASKLVGVFKGPLIRILGQVASKLLWFIGGPWGLLAKAIILLATLIIANWDSIWAWTKKVWGKLKPWLIDLVTKLGTAVANKIKSLVNDTKAKWNSIKSATSTAWNAIKTAATVAGAILVSTVKSKFTSLVNSARSKMNSAKSAVSSAWSSIKSNTSSAISSAVSTVTSKFSSMVNSARSKMTSVRTAISNAWNSIKSYLRGINLSSIGSNIIQGMINGVKAKASSLISAAKGVVSGAVNAAKNLLGIHSPSRVFFEFGEFVDKGFINGLLSMTSKVQKASEKMTEAAVPKKAVEIPTFASVNPTSTPSAVANQAIKSQLEKAEEERKKAEQAQQQMQAVINIGGYEAKGLISYITGEQEYEKNRDGLFKGR